MSDASLTDRYSALIDQIVQMTLKGNIRSKEQVLQMLTEGIEAGTGELFERCLSDRLSATEQQATSGDELKQAKAGRILRALQTIRGEWERWQAQNQVNAALDSAVQQIVMASGIETDDPLRELIRVTDPNLPQPLSLSQWQQLGKRLRQSPDTADLQQLGQGLLEGLQSWQRLENYLVSWIYDQSQGQIGFEGVPGQRGPWALWAKQVNRPVPAALFNALALGEAPIEWAESQATTLADFVELVVILRCLQQGLVNWFDKLIYDSKVGAKLSIATFLAFSLIWSQLGEGWGRSTLPSQHRLRQASFQVTLQILRTFAQQSYFPLYGGIFASFTGEYLRDAMSYLDEPLRQAEGTQEKARILTLLGSSARAMGQVDRAIGFHQQAVEIARTAKDTVCEIANLNHLSRTYVAQANYSEAINYSQRAVILSRQAGDRSGEANALANLGFSEVFQARQQEYVEPEVYEMAIERLQQGLQQAERLGDRQSQALCYSSLGIAQVLADQPQESLEYLDKGIAAAQFTGDVYLQGINLAYLAEAHYRLQNFSKAILTGSLGMYLLEQIGSTSWRQTAGLLVVIRGQLGETEFRSLLDQERRSIVGAIGVDGFDHVPELLRQYQD
ncbi:tetratricopeptide repeat protein [Leptolyngbya ohadii]|uniref:tetratricopeptide repeat protein n=1 Tax=Leptolyngbya ohadii TaxID=1962290 RepID=UPI000B599B5A|nr:tetratricopeptide repeat protein [Leptolyngbya ohadii]